MTTFSDAVRVPPITHEMIATHDRYDHHAAELAHLLLDQRTTARDLAATLEEQAHLLRVALASAAAMLDRVDSGDYFQPDEIAAVRAAVARALTVTA